MGIHFDTVGNLCAQIGAGALSSVEVLSKLIARIETFDDSINVVALSDFKERPMRFWRSR
jgi:Asp-tRNA(Asn)/Glu-tRNA(Gln) amidotransferase A subunit family amidase